MRAPRILAVGAVSFAVVAGAAPASADVLGPLLPAHTMEAGIARRNIKRTVSYSRFLETQRHEQSIEQTDIAAYGRYGLSSHATAAVELSSTPGDIAVTDGNGALYVVGASLQLGIWQDERSALSFGFHYASLYWRDDDPRQPDVEEQLLEWTLLLQRAWSAGEFDGMIWVGPIGSHFSLEQQLPADDTYQQPYEVYGALVGGNARFVQHTGVELQWLYVETSELHVALFYRF